MFEALRQRRRADRGGWQEADDEGRGPQSKKYQTPYGEVHVERYVYQSSAGGAQYCPLEANARIVRTATPLLAKQVAFKYSQNEASGAVMDIAQHGRVLSASYVREIAGDVASISSEKEEHWSYELPPVAPGKRVATVAIGTDGACALFVDGAWRQVMVGTIAFYDDLGERLATLYVANAPEPGKGSFFERMEREVARVRKRYPKARYVGVADGAHDQWVWLEKQTDWQVLDFLHASENLNAVAGAFGENEGERQRWAEDACHRLKHHKGAVGKLLAELRRAHRRGVPKAVAEDVEKTITYLENQKERMDYHFYRLMGLPIGSGLPASVPLGARIRQTLGFGAYSALAAFPDWHRVHDLSLAGNCLWQQLAGRVTFHSLGQTLTLVPGETAFLLPGEHEIMFPDPLPLAQISVVPDEPLRRLVRGFPDAHGMLRLLTPTGDPLHRISLAHAPGPVSGRHLETALRGLLHSPADWRFVQALGDGPCRALRDEEPREIEEQQDPAGAGRFPGSKKLAHFEIEPPQRRSRG